MQIWKSLPQPQIAEAAIKTMMIMLAASLVEEMVEMMVRMMAAMMVRLKDCLSAEMKDCLLVVSLAKQTADTKARLLDC